MSVKPQDINVGDIIIAERNKYSDGTGPVYILEVTSITEDYIRGSQGRFPFNEYTFHKFNRNFYACITSNNKVYC